MRIFKFGFQLSIIFIFLFLGNYISEIISSFIVIPGSIIGMLLLYVALILNIVKLSFIEETSQFFLNNMGFFFVPLGASIIESYILIQSIIWEVFLILILSNILVMGLTAKIVELLINRKENLNA